MKTANSLRKNKPVILRGATATQSQALKYAWWFENFRNRLKSGIWRFSYFKTDGQIREAYGTLDTTIIPEDKQPKREPDKQTQPCYDTFVYWDTEAQGWRSFRLDNFIGFVEQANV